VPLAETKEARQVRLSAERQDPSLKYRRKSLELFIKHGLTLEEAEAILEQPK
jgi:hypothetical protein